MAINVYIFLVQEVPLCTLLEALQVVDITKYKLVVLVSRREKSTAKVSCSMLNLFIWKVRYAMRRMFVILWEIIKLLKKLMDLNYFSLFSSSFVSSTSIPDSFNYSSLIIFFLPSFSRFSFYHRPEYLYITINALLNISLHINVVR